jgi:hypothetical protein
VKLNLILVCAEDITKQKSMVSYGFQFGTFEVVRYNRKIVINEFSKS